jgi:hypothetical protein
VVVLGAAACAFDGVAVDGHDAVVKVRRLVVALAMCVAVSCSSSTSNRADPLSGVGATKATGLCSEFAAAANALSASQNTLDTSAFDSAEGTFAAMANKARAAGAAEFARRLDDVSVAVRNSASYRIAHSGSTAFTVSEATKRLELDMRMTLPEIELNLACASRGYAVWGLNVETVPSNPPTTR